MLKSRSFLATVVASFVLHFTGPVHAQSPEKFDSVIVKAPKPYTKLVSDIRALGGRVKKQYKHVEAIAADVPAQALPDLIDLVGPDAVSKDLIVPLPSLLEPARAKTSRSGVKSKKANMRYDSVRTNPVTVTGANPYLLNNAGLNLQSLHSAGWTGAGVVVAIIDSGLKSVDAAGLVDYPHIAGSVIGCENFVDDPGDPGRCRAPGNGPHGTFVAGLVAAHAEFDLTGTDLLTSIQAHLPAALRDNKFLPLLGSAPGASIYAIRVFGGGGAPDSRIIDAIDRVIELRHSGINIKVCNLSIGGVTRNAGKDNLDQAIDVLLQNDILPVLSAGDAGPSSLTIASPATSFSSLAVGASSPAANARIYWDVSDAPGSGLLLRPFPGTQIAYFSSRGPNADGRSDPDVVAMGFGNIGQGTSPDRLDVGVGTSYSSAVVAGVAAVLRQAYRGNTATQIRNAIISTANPNLINDGSGVLDRGSGVVDAQAASQLLGRGRVSDSLPRPDKPGSTVRANIERDTGLRVLRSTVTQKPRNLKPGQRAEILYEITDQTDQVVISISNFTASAVQNLVFGDDLNVTVHSAKTSHVASGGFFGDYYVLAFTKDDTFVIDHPEPGVMRITISGDYFNAGPVSADIAVYSTQDLITKPTVEGTIADHGTVQFPVDIPAGATQVQFQLTWNNDWSHYPTSDIDFGAGPCGKAAFVLDPDGNRIVADVLPAHPSDPIPALDAPQRASVTAQPGTTLKKGRWRVVAFGCDIPPDNEKADKEKAGKEKKDKQKGDKKPDKKSKAATEELELRVTVDGHPLR